MAVMGKMPVFIRLGDGEEYEIGWVSPDVTVHQVPASGRITEMSASVDILTPLAELFSRLAAEAGKAARYDNGGVLPAGQARAVNNTGQPEEVTDGD
jgi:hypothetical protein